MILTSVDLPAPFSPSRARTEPPAATRSTPWRTSTPPNDFRIPRASSRKPVFKISRLAVLQLVELRDVRARDDRVRHEQLRRHLPSLDQADEIGHADLAVSLREV